MFEAWVVKAARDLAKTVTMWDVRAGKVDGKEWYEACRAGMKRWTEAMWAQANAMLGDDFDEPRVGTSLSR